MLYLTLIRHAKSSWADAGMDDFDRPLNERGLKNAPEMGQRLKKIKWLPDVMLASPAARTTATAKAIAAAVGYNPDDIVFDRKLYAAPAKQMLATTLFYAKGRKHVAVVAHNPGTSQLASSLSGEDLGQVPTCAVVRLQFDVNDWDELAAGSGKLLDFDYPKRQR